VVCTPITARLINVKLKVCYGLYILLRSASDVERSSMATPSRAHMIGPLLPLQVPWSSIMVLPLDTPAMIEGTLVTFIEANHCPGAAMVVAEPPNGAPVLHTGDARYV